MASPPPRYRLARAYPIAAPASVHAHQNAGRYAIRKTQSPTITPYTATSRRSAIVIRAVSPRFRPSACLFTPKSLRNGLAHLPSDLGEGGEALLERRVIHHPLGHVGL